MSNEREIRELFLKHGVGLSQNDVWMVQSSHVVKHKALERLAAALRIQFDAPTILRSERDEAVILVIGHLSVEEQGDGGRPCYVRIASEWSIGEALVNANYRVKGKMAPYVYAMAEKRAKDRVIIKLAGLHGVYSEDEADDFRDQPPQRTEDPAAAFVSKTLSDFLCFETPGELRKYWEDSQKSRERQGVNKGTAAYSELWSAFVARGKSLSTIKEAAE